MYTFNSLYIYCHNLMVIMPRITHWCKLIFQLKRLNGIGLTDWITSLCSVLISEFHSAFGCNTLHAWQMSVIICQTYRVPPTMNNLVTKSTERINIMIQIFYWIKYWFCSSKENKASTIKTGNTQTRWNSLIYICESLIVTCFGHLIRTFHKLGLEESV